MPSDEANPPSLVRLGRFATDAVRVPFNGSVTGASTPVSGPRASPDPTRPVDALTSTGPRCGRITSPGCTFSGGSFRFRVRGVAALDSLGEAVARLTPARAEPRRPSSVTVESATIPATRAAVPTKAPAAHSRGLCTDRSDPPRCRLTPQRVDEAARSVVSQASAHTPSRTS